MQEQDEVQPSDRRAIIAALARINELEDLAAALVAMLESHVRDQDGDCRECFVGLGHKPDCPLVVLQEKAK